MRDSAESSSFYFNKTYMIDKNVVKKLVDEWLADKEYFLVGIDISPMTRLLLRSTTLMAFGLKTVWR